MIKIAITSPDFISGEVFKILHLLEDGSFDFVHLRKPGACYADCAAVVDKIPVEYRSRIVTHEHFSLAQDYGLGGIHLNRRNPNLPEGWRGRVSCSCHSFEEVSERKPMCDYVFLSPVYDSISKQGYGSAFSLADLREAAGRGILDGKVIALGGITEDRIPELLSVGFGGVAMLGALWR